MSREPLELGGGTFSIDGVELVIDIPPQRPSLPNSFTLAKSEPFIRFYEKIAESFRPSGILELGIFQGGSFVLIDKLFSPQRMSAADLAPDPGAPIGLRRAAAGTERALRDLAERSRGAQEDRRDRAGG